MAKIVTFGCRLNSCESEQIEQFANELGLDDFIIINTCAVTAEAERQLRQMIRRFSKKNAKIILTGCASQLHGDDYLKMDGVVGIIPNTRKLVKDEYRKFSPNHIPHIFDQPIKRVRGFLQIQNGCNHRCTYCVVRLTRGPNVSFDKDDIVKQAKILVEKGYKEIVLTGVNISSYGTDLASKENLVFIMNYILQNVPEISRLRISSMDPADINQEFINFIGNEARVMPHIHESIQSGDDIILKRMLRRHSRQQVIDINNRILELRPDIVFGADIIVGFPTETDEMFENTKKLLVEANISLLHFFGYSKRPDTPAAFMPQVNGNTKHKRISELKNFSSDILNKALCKYIGKATTILAETEYTGKTDSFLNIKTNAKLIPGMIYDFTGLKIEGNTLVGSIK